MTATGLVLIAIAVGLFVLAPQIEATVRDRFESSLEEVFGTEVTLGAISLSPLRQRLEIAGCTVMNPPGFHTKPAFTSSLIRIRFDPKTVFSSTPVVRSTEILDAEVFYRHEAGEGLNIDHLSTQAGVYLGQARARQFVVEEVNCEDAKVHFSTNLIPKTRVGLKLIDIRLDDVGEGAPLSGPKVAGIILRSVFREVVTLRGLLGGGESAEAEPLW